MYNKDLFQGKENQMIFVVLRVYASQCNHRKYIKVFTNIKFTD